jgi:hypothetical protein
MRTMPLLLSSALALVLAGCDTASGPDDGVDGGAGVTVTVSANNVTWLAYQDGDGPWRVLVHNPEVQGHGQLPSLTFSWPERERQNAITGSWPRD